MLSKAYAQAMAQRIDLHRASQGVEPGDPWPFQDRKADRVSPVSQGAMGGAEVPEHTTNVVAIDSEWNMVTMLTSLATSFGSMVTIPETGILLGNGMLAFNPVPGTLNSIRPGRQPFKNPTSVLLFKDGNPFATIAAAGGRRISGASLNIMVNLIDLGMGIQDAIDASRLHCERGPVFVDSRMPEKLALELRSMGHNIVLVEENSSRANFARPVGGLIDPVTRTLHAGGDSLRSTGVAGL
jgi:gamma-glutamyltranspeptidase/glutathione hydrolase